MGLRDFEAGTAFTRLDAEIVKSDAFQALTYGEQALLVEFIGKLRSVKERTMILNFEKRTNRTIKRDVWHDGVHVLVRVGFIDRVHENGKRACFSASDRWMTFRNEPWGKIPRTVGKNPTVTVGKNPTVPWGKIPRTVGKNPTDRGENPDGLLILDVDQEGLEDRTPSGGTDSGPPTGAPGVILHPNGTERHSQHEDLADITPASRNTGACSTANGTERQTQRAATPRTVGGPLSVPPEGNTPEHIAQTLRRLRNA